MLYPRHRILSVLFVVAAVLMLLGTASADNLLTDGNFNGLSTGALTNSGFNGGPYNQWIAAGDGTTQGWTIAGGCASPDGGNCAQHLEGTYRMWQAIDATGLTAGQQMLLTFDYTFAYGDNNAPYHEVFVYGIGPGGTLDKFPPYSNDPISNVNLVHQNLGITDPSATTGDGVWESVSIPFSLDQHYDALAVSFLFGADGSNYPSPGLRAVDSVSLTAVPEPSSLVLLPVGFLSLLFLAREKKTQVGSATAST